MAESDGGRIQKLIHTALFDEGGETIEGAFVDQWVSNASLAIEELEDCAGEATAEDRSALVESLRRPKTPVEPAVTLLTRLAGSFRETIETLLLDASPHARAIAVRARSASSLDHLHRFLNDPDPEVRAAVVVALHEHRQAVPDADALLAAALRDPDAQVRAAAARATTFYRNPEGRRALLERLDKETSSFTRGAAIREIAQTVRSEGVNKGGRTFEEDVGREVIDLLLLELANPDPAVRKDVASAMERFRGEEIARAMLVRLKVEQDLNVRATLLLFNGFSYTTEDAFPVIADLVEHDPEPLIRTRAAFLLEWLGVQGAPVLVRALFDPGASRAAVMSLGKVGDQTDLPALATLFAQPSAKSYRREIENAVRDIVATTWSRPELPPTAAWSRRVQELIDEIEPVEFGDWPMRVAKEDLNAYPVRGNLIFVWNVRPDGSVVCLDHEAYGHPWEVETDHLVRFGCLFKLAQRHPELASGVPPPLERAKLCTTCLSTGEPQGVDKPFLECSACNGWGWVAS